MAPVYARIVHEGKIQTVALIEGIDTEELVSLLKTVFSVSGNIVGLLAEVRNSCLLSRHGHCNYLDSCQKLA